MEGLTIGRIVHYLMQLEGMVGTAEYAAIVSRVYQANDGTGIADQHNEGDVALHAFTENGVTVVNNAPYSAEKLPNTWHWIERA